MKKNLTNKVSPYLNGEMFEPVFWFEYNMEGLNF